MMHIACGHDPRRCCESCCPDEEGSNGKGGGCNICQGLAFPRVGDGMTDEQIAEFADIMLAAVRDRDPNITEALRLVLHVTRGDPTPVA